MNYWFGGAAMLSGVLAGAHIFGGTPEFLAPVVDSDLPADIRAVAAIVWHGTSVLLVANSVVLFGAFIGRKWLSAVLLVAVQYIGFVALFLYYGQIFLGNFTDLMQWSAFAIIAGLIWLGSRSGNVQ